MGLKEILYALQERDISPEDARKGINKAKEAILEQQSAESGYTPSSNCVPELEDFLTEEIREKPYYTIKKEMKMQNKTFVNQPEVKQNPPLTNIEITPGPVKSVTDTQKEYLMKDSVAIIGMSGQFPNSKDLKMFWDNIAQGRDCISEIPAARWSIDKYYNRDPKTPGVKTYSKWMGSLEDIDKFDPLFFNISPAEAELLDPQQRLFIENCWHSIEDAGINPLSLSGSNCGVFVGCMNGDYGQSDSSNGINVNGLMSGAISMLSGRVSYLLNLRGPCLAIDTACSSSLVAIAEACNSLILNNSDLALAGGVYIMTGPAMHIMTSKAGMLSKDGRCFPFDTRANGFVPGEGVGVVLLKRLSDAVQDKDPIYGVIRGWGINQDGKTNGITAPSMNSQRLLEQGVYKRFGINPEAVSLVEAHGTGTKLGDPIEVEALIKSFRYYTQREHYCALGSVKSNIGHLLQAAGVAGVIKVLLAIQHKMLPPTINFETLNEHIQLDNSPFYVNTKLQSWETAAGVPRCACVSSFGVSGTNAHIVIEEYIPENNASDLPRLVNAINAVLFVLSAKSEERLKSYAESMKCYISSHEDLDLQDIAYTLQVGRVAMDYRMAFLADSKEAVLKSLEVYIKNDLPSGVLINKVKKGKDGIMLLETDEDAKVLLQTWIQKRKLKKVAELWVNGLNIDWNLLYGNNKPSRLSLPAYPFAKERYWISENGTKGSRTGVTNTRNDIHPLLQQNISNFSKQCFSSDFTKREKFILNNVSTGQSIIPGLTYLEMVRAGMNFALCAAVSGSLEKDQTEIIFRNISWSLPTVVGDIPVQIQVGLFPEDNGEITFEINELDGTGVESIIYCSGSVVQSMVKERPSLDIDELQSQCNQQTITSCQFYDIYKSTGFEYAPEHMGIDTLFLGNDQVLAKLVLPSSAYADTDQYILHPCIIDSALQASVCLMLDIGKNKPVHPVALKELEAIKSCTPVMWAWIRYSSLNGDNPQEIQIDLCDETGMICIHMRGIEIKEITENLIEASLETRTLNTSISKPEEEYEIMTFEEVWKERALPDTSTNRIKTLVCFITDFESKQVVVETVQKLYHQSNVIFISQGNAYERLSQQLYNVCKTEPGTYRMALQSIGEDYGEVDAVLYLWPLEDPSCIKDYSCIVNVLQGIALGKLKTGRLLLAAQFNNGLDYCYLESWIGFERSLGLIMPNMQIATVYQDNSGDNGEALTSVLLLRILAELQVDKVQSILYQNGKRHIYQIRSTEVKVGESLLRVGGTYIITGGCGGLGLLFAHHFAKTKQVNLVLIGRTPINSEIHLKIKGLEDLGSRVMYVQADISDPICMQEGLNQAKGKFGEIHGVIHAAGIQSDKNIFEKDIQSFQKIIDPKIAGTIILDELLKEDPIDYVCYFSSSAAILGDFGFCDYAIGNRFQMAYAHYRDNLKCQGQRHGKSLVINWPLWKDGGMGFDEDDTTKLYLKSSGQRYLEAKEGLQMFERLLSHNSIQHLVLVGQRSRVQQFLGLVKNQTPLQKPKALGSLSKRREEMKGFSNEQCIEWDIKDHISKLLKIPKDKLDNETNLSDFGFDSIKLSELARLLSNHYNIEIAPALFFGYSTIGKLIQYFAADQQELITNFYKEDVVGHIVSQGFKTMETTIKRHSYRESRYMDGSVSHSIPEPIAVIGISGRFPNADTIEEFWNNINNGKNCINEIPSDRWDWRRYYGSISEGTDKTNSKWGGFMRNVDRFDPIFFEISPKEAELMDPQQRLFLEEAWHALEDAGYMGERIRGKQCGVYVGVEESQYAGLIQESGQISSNQNAMLPARIAYKLDLKGPNFALTTACSSGLVAIHQACSALRQGDCEMALVGGVSLLVSPMPYLALGQIGMLSPSGKCSVFDQHANGLVPGEAVAVVLLKPLSKAIADKDHIYGCIKASGVNYDGKTNGITAPNPISQTDLINGIYDKYRIISTDIQYVMAHSVGSQLGDPIEFQAITNAFKKYTNKRQYCTIGSIKPLIGHTFAASGVVSLIGMLMAMKHKVIPATHNYDFNNEYINLKESPFNLTNKNQMWLTSNNQPRMGAISTIGISGTNAHAVIEEYISNTNTDSLPALDNLSQPKLFVLSAKSIEQLKSYTESMKNFIESHEKLNLADMAYTLQVGREAMNYRMAFWFDSREALLKILECFGKGSSQADVFIEHAKKNKEEFENMDVNGGVEAYLKTNNKKLAELWARGLNVDFGQIYGKIEPNRISLPVYPFVKDRCWVNGTDNSDYRISAVSSAAVSSMHPLLHQNTSDVFEQRFTSVFTGEEFFFTDHLVQGQKVLPGVAYLEMACAAIEKTLPMEKDRDIIRLKNVVWAQPIVVREQAARVHITLYPQVDGQIPFKIYSRLQNTGEEPIVHSQGSVILDKAEKAPLLDLVALQKQYSQICLSSAQCYEVFKAMGIDYGPRHQGVGVIYKCTGPDNLPRVLAKLILPSMISDTLEKFILHPCLMDSALHASIGLLINQADLMLDRSKVNIKLALPFAVQEIDIYSSCKSVMWTLIRFSDGSQLDSRVKKLDVDICDETGKVCVRVKGLSIRELKGQVDSVASPRVEIQQQFYYKLRGDRNDLLEMVQFVLMKALSEVIMVEMEDINLDDEFIEYGVNPITLAKFSDILSQEYQFEISPTLFFECSTLRSLAKYLIEKYKDIFIQKFGIEDSTNIAASKENIIAPVVAEDFFKEKAINYLKNLVSSFIKLPTSRIEEDTSIEKYGIDSIMAIQLTNQLEKAFGPLSKTVIFEYQDIKSLTGYFLKHHRLQFMRLLGIIEEVEITTDSAGNTMDFSHDIEPLKLDTVNDTEFSTDHTVTELRKEKEAGYMDIAIIAVSGRYPCAGDIQEFWSNLKAGKDCISEIPQERWDNSIYFDEDKNKPGKTYCKWGGFIEGVDKFDPLFFNISPKEAEIMDPQERLFLETVWIMIEGIGYTRETLQDLYKGKVGIYVGAMNQHYSFINTDIVRESITSLSSYHSIANRVSRFFNFQGPSITMETACSSSTTAIHIACESLKKGECQLAIAGGVNLSIHPKKYLAYSSIRLIGSHINSRSFGNGDGFLPAEGVGAVLLKPLSRAVEDGDSILAVIKSTAINHGGQSNGFTPNPNAQEQLIVDNFIKAGIDPRTVSYVEAAANGSALGDAIEVTALKKAFEKFTNDKYFCAIGSVKSNIGNPEAASGILQLTKIILQMQNRQLVPSIKAEPLNPNIDFDNSPFYLQQQLQEWKRPVVMIQGEKREFPRRATVSSFGAGGSNAHLIVEEHTNVREEKTQIARVLPQIVVFSAKSQERLIEVIRQMVEFIEFQEGISLSELAYTLQVGREAMEFRAAMISDSVSELIRGMKEYLKAVKEGESMDSSIPIFTGELEEFVSGIRNLLSGKAGEAVLQVFIAENNLEKIAFYWVKGGKISWEQLHQGNKLRKIFLPTYPFEKRRCWIEEQYEHAASAKNNVLLNSVTTCDSKTSLKDQIIDILARALGMTSAEVSLNMPLDKYGIDSIIMMQLFHQLQTQIDPSIDLIGLKECRTAQDIVNILVLSKELVSLKKQVSNLNSAVWTQFPEVIRLNKIYDGRPVFWFHAAQGGVEGYHIIAQKSQRPFYGIQARGWMTENEPLQGVHAMVDYYLDIIRTIQPEGPYDFGGYSFGGCLAYELTRELQELGQTVNSIVMLDTMYSDGMSERADISRKALMLQTINMGLLTTVLQEPEKIPQILINRSEIDINVDDEVFLKQLITLGKTRGLAKTETQLLTHIQQCTKIQEAFEINNYSILPLPNSHNLTCYYFRNNSGLFFGGLEPYFTIKGDEVLFEGINYWEEWERQLPNFKMINVDSSNHMMLLSEPKSYGIITAFCEKLYSKDSNTKDLLNHLKKNTRKVKNPKVEKGN